jgi:glutamate synthase (NADPH/NADH) small chain
MEKSVVERRVKIMREDGIAFVTNTYIGIDKPAKELVAEFDAVVLAGGAEYPRDIPVEGRDLQGIHFAMEFLTRQNRENLGVALNGNTISAKGKNVIVLGGGDTGSDCIGTSNRQGAKSVKNYELLPQPPNERDAGNPWPQWAFIERTSSSHEEGCERDYGIMTKKFSGKDGKVEKLHAIRLEFGAKDPETGRRSMNEITGSEFEVNTDLVLLALGFTGPKKPGMLEELEVELDDRGNVKTNASKMTSVERVFAAGDMRRGQSLVVWAINEGRETAMYVNNFLKSKKATQ